MAQKLETKKRERTFVEDRTEVASEVWGTPYSIREALVESIKKTTNQTLKYTKKHKRNKTQRNLSLKAKSRMFRVTSPIFPWNSHTEKSRTKT